MENHHLEKPSKPLDTKVFELVRKYTQIWQSKLEIKMLEGDQDPMSMHYFVLNELVEMFQSIHNTIGDENLY